MVEDMTPCPFCGGEASLGSNVAGLMAVFCTQCWTQGPWGECDWQADGETQTTQKRASAIRRWNARPKGIKKDLADEREKVRILREALDKFWHETGAGFVEDEPYRGWCQMIENVLAATEDK